MGVKILSGFRFFSLYVSSENIKSQILKFNLTKKCSALTSTGISSQTGPGAIWKKLDLKKLNFKISYFLLFPSSRKNGLFSSKFLGLKILNLEFYDDGSAWYPYRQIKNFVRVYG